MYLKGEEGPLEIILLSYGMEAGLEGFYEILAGEIKDPEVVTVLTNLSRIEDKHKQKLFDLYLILTPTPMDRDTFETRTVPEVMEGGFTTQEFLERHKPAMTSVPEILSIAMMLETQALDLYLRYSRSIRDEKSKNLLYEIAEEEKAHLETLGHLLERQY